MSEHTPGPWHYEVRPGHSAGLRYVVTNDTIDRIAVISERGGAEWPEANARLIAAAPALLEALEDARAQLEEYERERTGEQFNNTRINAAIAAAKGEGE